MRLAQHVVAVDTGRPHVLHHLRRDELPVVGAVARLAPGLAREDDVDPSVIVERRVAPDGIDGRILDPAPARERGIQGIAAAVARPRRRSRMYSTSCFSDP